MNLIGPPASGSEALVLRSTRIFQPFGACARSGVTMRAASTATRTRRLSMDAILQRGRRPGNRPVPLSITCPSRGKSGRGDVRWAKLNPVRGHEQAGRRPVLILSHDVFNERSGAVIAVAMTSQPQRAGFPLTLELRSKSLPKRSWVKISQIRTLALERIGKKIGKASSEELAAVVEGLNEIIGS